MTVSTGASCDAVVNYSDPSLQSNCYQSLLITEANTNTPDMLEIQNMQNATVNYTGYIAVISDDYNNINDFNSQFWQLGTFSPGQYQSRDDNSGSPNYWGNNMFWNSTASSWAMILAPNGDVVDAVFWGWDSVAIAGFSAVINGNTVTIPPSVWSGNGVPTSCNNSYARQGTGDNNTASDWSCVTVSTGTQNPGWNPTIGGGGSGSAPSPTLQSGLASGATFPIGTTTNVWTWADTALGLQDSCSFTITVEDSTAPIAVCQNATVQLSASGSGTLSATQVDGGSSDNCALGSVSVNQTAFDCSNFGANTVTLTVTDANGIVSSCTASVSVVDTAGLTQVPVNLPPSSSLCDGTPLTLDAGAGQASYQWTTGDTTQTITVNTAGSYGVTVTSPQGCMGFGITGVSLVTVAPSNPMGNGGPAVVCQNGTLDLIADPGYQSYVWSTGSTSQTATTNTGGIVTVTVTDSSGCSRTDSLNVTFINSPGPVAAIIPAANPVYACNGNPTVLDAGSGFNNYNWSTGSVQQTITVNAGTYNVTVTDANGCWDASSNVQVVDTTIPAPVLTIVGDSICAPPAVGYSWTFNGFPTGVTTQCIFGNADGTYECTLNELVGCTSTASIMYVGIEDAIGQGLFAQAAPNPFGDATKISIEAPYLCSATLKVYSLTGEHVATIFEGEMTAGDRQEIEFRPDGLPTGMYVFRLVTDQGHSAMGKVMYMR